MNGDIKKSILRSAQEYNEGISSNDTEKLRQAADKAWRAVVQSSFEYVNQHGIFVEVGPEEHVEVRAALSKLGMNKLASTNGELATRLHGDCSYHGSCENELDLLKTACEYVQTLTGESTLCAEFNKIIRKGVK